jgi:dihydropteroate synthase
MKSLPELGKRTFVMGILNVTPDSFSGDGLLSRSDFLKAALSQAEEFIEAGADILDIGGESTRPGSTQVSEDEEISRVQPVIKSLRANGISTLISIDTYKSDVAQAALDAGADWINDVWGFHADPQLPVLAARLGVAVVLMHNRSKPNQVELQQRLGASYSGADYEDLLKNVKSELMLSVAIAREAGVKDENIILDPGIGFGKTVWQNLELVNRLDEIKALGFPVLLGPSRKSFIGYTLDLPPSERLEGTLAACSVGITRGAAILRVHDVIQVVRLARMTDAIVKRRNLE